jgi:hypothetical protein
MAQPRRQPSIRTAGTQPAASRSTASTVTAMAASAGRSALKAAAAVAGRLAPSPTEAVVFLSREHDRLRELFEKGEKTTARGVKVRTELLHTLAKELAVHEIIEEEIFYTVLRRHAEARDIVLEGVEEHHVCDLIVEELLRMRRSDERWGAKFNVLKENVEHHLEEEEDEMFKTARSVLSHQQLEDLGAQMAATKAAKMQSDGPVRRPQQARRASTSR